eukprot:CAMPEP_0201932496 /NCGR_PEP_ID=MMETSP0903-20130614/29637_1 /ASSEMBLY_ACC=CAM_ASM_000552 /TAXON_ID=420261 /ORGANISM="Thalassiosira antarctica, Strain CCMP982" /LENGTH=632 /DNA_ID=CAMNT_0048472143 /DNA_START=144 /DNA_END=2042 /DNA_ORIENTATION=+
MSSGSLIIKQAPSEASAQDEASPSTNDNSNRLAPYNPTHATAQSKALDLLQLTSHDIFFDLGCGDGRLITAALERCYDDDFLMRVHQERFARLQLHSQEENLPPRQQQEIHRSQSVERTSSINSQKIHLLHSRSHSDYSFPHLMRDGDEDSELDISVDQTPYRIPHHHDKNDSGSVGVLSAPSPLSAQQQALIPTTPVTPIVDNRRSFNKLNAGSVKLHPPPALPSAEFANQQQVISEDTLPRPDIPKTIETPSPTGKQHTLQISELPTLADTFGDQVMLATVPSGGSMHGDDEEDSSLKPSWTGSDETNDGNNGGAVSGVVGGSKVGGGLQCVGIEYNQALADTAQVNVQKSYIYPHVVRKVCIRWGDVLEEWNRGREGGDNHDGAGNGRENDNLQKRGATTIMQGDQIEGDDNDEDDASKLTLLQDATAVFVYLLPQGLKKIKPLLHEAATRRRRQQESQHHQHQQKQHHNHQQQQQRRDYMLHHPLQQQSLLEKEKENTTIKDDGGESCPLPRQLIHRKGFSHMSDITDYDFRTTMGFSHMSDITDYDFRNSKGSMGDIQEGNVSNMQRTTLDEKEVALRDTIPSFRVVSYMFSIPGWTPAKVDRSSKGGCSLFLYENIHEEVEGKREA